MLSSGRGVELQGADQQRAAAAIRTCSCRPPPGAAASSSPRSHAASWSPPGRGCEARRGWVMAEQASGSGADERRRRWRRVGCRRPAEAIRAAGAHLPHGGDAAGCKQLLHVHVCELPRALRLWSRHGGPPAALSKLQGPRPDQSWRWMLPDKRGRPLNRRVAKEHASRRTRVSPALPAAPIARRPIPGSTPAVRSHGPVCCRPANCCSRWPELGEVAITSHGELLGPCHDPVGPAAGLGAPQGRREHWPCGRGLCSGLPPAQRRLQGCAEARYRQQLARRLHAPRRCRHPRRPSCLALPPPLPNTTLVVPHHFPSAGGHGGVLGQ